MLRDKKIIVAHISLIIFFGFAVYANSLCGKFIWDDYIQIQDNIYLEKITYLPKLLTADIGEGGGVKSGLYRPLQMLTNFINYHIWGINPGGYHFTNIILHLMVALCIYWLVSILFKKRTLSFLASILFVVHPIQTEAVSYISGRADSLSVFFMLLAFIFYVKSLNTDNLKSYILVFLAYSAGLLSKENILVFPVLILLYHYSFKEKLPFNKFIWILTASFAYILLKLFLLHSFLPTRVAVPGSVLQRIPGFFAAFSNYIRLTLLPLDLHMEYPHKLFSLSDPNVLSGILLLALVSGYLFKMRNNKLVIFSLGWFLLALIPVSNIFWATNSSFMMEHWMYLPSIGLILFFADLLCITGRKEYFKIPVAIFTISAILFYSYLTIKQNSYWLDDISFYKRTLKYNPNSARIYYNLGLSYWNASRISDAIQAYQSCLAVNPDYFLAHNNLAVAFFHENNFDLAIKHADRALELGYHVDPDFLLLLKPYRRK